VVGLILWILICYFVGRAADRKNRSFTSFFLIPFFVSPIVGAVIVAALPPTQEMLIAKGRMRACGRCAQAIQLRASVCAYCGSGPDLVGPGAQQARHAQRS
jgi:hypothetical protein